MEFWKKAALREEREGEVKKGWARGQKGKKRAKRGKKEG